MTESNHRICWNQARVNTWQLICTLVWVVNNNARDRFSHANLRVLAVL